MSKPVDLVRRKQIAIAFQGAKCANCNKKYDPREPGHTEELWQFAHLGDYAVRNGHNKGDTWGYYWRFQAPFTDEWYKFMERTRLTCSQRCNRLVEVGRTKQQEYDVQMREDHSMHMMKQLRMDL